MELFKTYENAKTFLSTFIGVIVTIVAFGVIFVISSLEGTKEIKVSNSKSAEILEYWQSQGNEGFPENILIDFEGKEYYFSVKEYKTVTEFILDSEGNYMLDQNGIPLTKDIEVIDKWYFAYDGGIGYVFEDIKFYVLTLMTIVVSIYVSSVNYTSTVRSVRGTENFIKTLTHYQERKNSIEKYTQYIPNYCIYKNKQAYEMAKRDIVEDAGINYEFYNSKEFSIEKLEKWQVKKLNRIKRIKIKKIRSSDLLQENGQITTKIELLPMGQLEHQRKFMFSSTIQRIISSALSGMVVAFGVELGNWVLGLTYGLTIVMSFAGAIIVATDFVSTTLRNRYLAKADLLNEFNNIKDMFIPKDVL
jgi:hypothetical protein